MGKAFILLNIDLSNNNIGQVTFLTEPVIIPIIGLEISNKPTNIENTVQLSIIKTPSNTTQTGVYW
jgi:hypothetical protein